MGRRVAFFVLAALFAFSTYCGADVIKLKLANYFPPTHMNSVMMGKYCEELNKKLAGKVEVTQYTGSTLLSAEKVAVFRPVLPTWDCQISPIRRTLPHYGNHGIAPWFSEPMDCRSRCN